LAGVADRVLGVMLEQTAPIRLDVGFVCAPGQVLALFGPSGSGKTTILRSIAGLYSPQVGLITMGTDTWLDAAAGVNVPVHRRQVGFVFQDYALFPHLTALGNVMTALGHRVRDERRARAVELLKLVHLEDRVDRRPSALSGGERQRVAVARALAREPRVLLLDEPFAAVDRSLRRTLHSEIDDIRRSFDIPIVLVTHDFEDVVRLATEIVILQSGEAVANGPIEELTSRPDLPWLREMAGLGSIVEGAVVRIHDSRGLAELAFGGNVLLAPAKGLVVGARVRVRIPAREVILATDAPNGLSLHNALQATVIAVHPEPTSGQVVVQLQAGSARILAEVTADAVARLGIVQGTRLHALIKSMSLEVRTTGPEPPGAHAQIGTSTEGDEGT
jgi:molybdate transport system ATP-binding protein